MFLKIYSDWTHRITFLSKVLFPILLLASCNPFVEIATGTPSPISNASLIDRSILTDIPCKAPCWHGLYLAESQEADVLAMLSTLSFIDQNAIEEKPYDYWVTLSKTIPGKWISAGCKEPVGVVCADFVIADDKLSMIGLFPNSSITFKEVVSHLGPPNFLRADLIPPVGNGCQIRLFWVQQQIIVEHIEPDSNKLCREIAHQNKKNEKNTIDPSLEIRSITYILPNNIQLTAASSESNYNYLWPGFQQ